MPVDPTEWFSLKAPAGFIQIQNSRSGEEEINKTFVSESRWFWQSTDLNHEDLQIRRTLLRSEAGEEHSTPAPQVALISKFQLLTIIAPSLKFCT